MKNVFQMLLACEYGNPGWAYPLFIQRDSWHGRTCLEVLGTAPELEGWARRGGPYYGTPGVWGWLFARGVYQLIEVSCPSTFAYNRIEAPAWWCPPAVGWLKLARCSDVVPGGAVSD